MRVIAISHYVLIETPNYEYKPRTLKTCDDLKINKCVNVLDLGRHKKPAHSTGFLQLDFLASNFCPYRVY